MSWILFAESYRVVRVESGIDWPVSILLTLIATITIWTLTWSYNKCKRPRKRRP